LKIKHIPFSEVFGEYKDIMRRVPDLSKALRILGYRPRVTTEQAIRKTIESVRNAKK